MEKNLTMDTNVKSGFWLNLLKGVLFSISISLILVLVFAFILRFINIPDTAIMPVNQVIKCLSILIGCLIALSKKKEMGLISGLLIGITYSVLSFVIFSILDGNFVFSKTLLNDILFGGIIGAICGIISVSIRRK